MSNSLTLSNLLNPWGAFDCAELAEVEVTHLELDSRAVSSGDIFVAVIGHAVDGRRFIDKAIELGARAVIAQACEEHVHGSVELRNGVAIAYIQDLNQALSALAGRIYQSDATQQ